jgi:hypothetical protein
MGTKLEALVDALKADGTEEEEIIEQLIVDNFTKQYLPEYDVNGTTYEVLTQAEIDDQLYELAEGEADDLKSDMEEILRQNNYLMIQMLRTMDNADCINIVLNNYDEDTLGEKLNKTLLLEEAGYFIYIKE